ncbi:pinopsin-like [Ciona intestinalis]
MTTAETTTDCYEKNPYIRNGMGWIPKHILIADRHIYTVLAVYMTFIFLLAVSLNGFVIIATMKNKKLRQPLNYIIINLSIADFLSGLVGGFVGMVSNSAGYFYFGKTVCVLEGYTVSVAGVCGLMSISVMAFERYFVVCKPYGPFTLTNSHAALGIGFTWTWSVLWSTPGLIWLDGYVPEGLGTSCAPNWFSKNKSERIFIFVYFVFCFFIPLLVIIICYGKIVLFLKQATRQSSASSNRQADNKVTKMVLVMISAFVICWTPYGVLSLYNAINPDKQLSYGLGTVPVFFAKTANIYNPLIYIGLNKQFRDGVIKMVFRGRNPWTEEMSTQQRQRSTEAAQPMASNEV